MATQMHRVFHSSLTKTGWIVSEGGESYLGVAVKGRMKRPPLLPAKKPTKMAASAKSFYTRTMAPSAKSAPMAETPKERH